MGKKRTTLIDDSSPKEAKKKTIFRWEDAYQELPVNLAQALRTARVKPQQLRAMPDGEILAIEGVNPDSLEIIRSAYPTETLSEINEAVVESPVELPAEEAPKKSTNPSPRLRYPTNVHGRSKLYKNKKSKVENKSYPVDNAIDLLKKISYGKAKTIELHLNVSEAGIRGEAALPHSTGKVTRVAIYSPEVAAAIKAEKIDFDILLATPKDMPQIAPLARFLGPRGLMPNPKNGSVTEDPQARAKKLSAGGTFTYKTEAKSPIMHLSIGKLDQTNSEIQANLKALFTTIGLNKIKSAYLTSTMSPSVRLDINSI